MGHSSLHVRKGQDGAVTSSARLDALAAAAARLRTADDPTSALAVVAVATGAPAAVWLPGAQTVLAVDDDGRPLGVAGGGVRTPDRPESALGAGEQRVVDIGSATWSLVGLPGGGLLGVGAGLGEDGRSFLALLAELAAPQLRTDPAPDSLQRALLPQSLPFLPAIELAADYAPGHEGGSGDWYDAFELPDGKIGIAVGDTMGRGVRAAATMGQVRAALRAYAMEGHSPADVLRLLDAFVRTFDESAFTTCAYALYEPAARRLSAASAGHVPPLVVDPVHGARYLELDPGVPLGAGAMRSGFLVDHVLGLPVDATVLLFTDGLLAGRDDGLERVRVAAEATAAAGPDALVAALRPAAPEAPDDVALVAMRARSVSPAAADGSRALDVELPPSVHAARVARDRVLAALADWGHGGSDDAGGPGAFEAVDAVVLLTDELVTNAVVHAHSSLRLQLRGTPAFLRVAVTDESPRLPAPRNQEPLAEGGRGLRLVELLASRWGVDPLPLGKRIWFEVDLPRG